MNELSVFNFRDQMPVRISDRNGEPWFVAADVCKALALKNPTKAVQQLDEDEFSALTFSYTGKSGRKLTNRLNIVSESGLYALVIRSNKPEAREFRRWITAEVLPAIRRTGRYEAAVSAAPVIREKPLVQTIAEMVRNLNERITAGEDVPAHILKYAWNMAGITRDLTLRHQRNALFAGCEEFSLRESAPGAESAIITALEESVEVLPGMPQINSTTDRIFIRSGALQKMLCNMPPEWKDHEVEMVRRAAAAGLLPKISATVQRFPHHTGKLKRASGVFWNEMLDVPVRVIDASGGRFVEVDRD